MMTCKSAQVACLSLFLFSAAASPAAENALIKQNELLAHKVVSDNVAREQLLAAAEYGDGEALAVKTVDGVCMVLLVENYPEGLTAGEIREFLEMQGVNALVKHLAANSKVVRDCFSGYHYKQILFEYAGSRLVRQVKGDVEMKGVSIDYASNGDYHAILIRAPEAAVDTKAVSIVSSDEARRYYIVALLDRVKAAMEGGHFDLAARFLLEARKMGCSTKGLFLDLYKCYAETDSTNSLEKLTTYLLKTRGNELTMVDCVRLARVAKQKAMKQQSRVWYLEAEARVNKGLQFEMLLPGE
ncbi:MAG: hypothetical protein QNL39_05820 [Akkermansiaceae bacterium]